MSNPAVSALVAHGLDVDVVAGIIAEHAPRFVRAAVGSGAVEAVLRRRLAPFCASAEATAILAAD